MGQMDFDAYEYLEKEVGNPEPEKLEEKVNGGKVTVESEDREHRRSSKHKNSENDNDLYHRSKYAKSGDESRDRGRESGDRDRERGSHDTERADRDRERGHRDRERGVRDHSSPRDVERRDRDRHRRSGEHRNREKDSDREDRNGKNRDRERERDRDRDRDIGREKDRERGSRDYERDNDKERDMESERERSHRSRSRSERQRDELDREKSLERERDIREPKRESRRYKEKETAEPEVDPERDQRTVFAYQISLKADERDVFEFFSKAGKVRDVKLIMDRNSGRSKGVGYIEFYDAASVPMAIALSGQLFLKHPVMVKPSEAEKNLVQSTVSVAGGAGGLVGPYSGGARRLYVGNLHFNIREDQLRQVFEPFGTVELVQLPLDQETGHSNGYGFVQFARLEEARTAQSLNGLEIAGQPIKVSTVTDQAGMQYIGANPGDFDDDEGGGLALNARSRAILMQKLDRTGTVSSITGTLGNHGTGLAPPTISPLIAPLVRAPIPAVTIPSFDIIGVPSECLLLKNMFDPKLESDPDFDLDIKEDVQEECSKYGMLKHLFVDKNTAGSVYLRFDNTRAAMGAQRALHGRWFAGKMITATFMLPCNYEAKFPDSRKDEVGTQCC